MVITREALIKLLSEDSGFFQKDVRSVLQSLDDVMVDLFVNVPYDEDLYVQLFEGCKLKARLVKERERVDPRTQKPIVCSDTVKLGVKYSDQFKNKIQELYNSKKDG